MPLYEYQCDDCGLRFERRQPITADPLEKCPECGGKVHRLIHPVGIIFKGKGFYVTDNRKAKSSTAVPKSKSDSNSTTEKSKKSEKSESSSKDSKSSSSESE
jgi:putative FmdB family regulatory protein